jgi:hypothetical protein
VNPCMVCCACWTVFQVVALPAAGYMVRATASALQGPLTVAVWVNVAAVAVPCVSGMCHASPLRTPVEIDRTLWCVVVLVACAAHSSWCVQGCSQLAGCSCHG